MSRTKLRLIAGIAALTLLSASAYGCSSAQSQGASKQVEEMLNTNALSGGNSIAEEVYQLADVTIGDISETNAAKGYVSLPLQYDVTHDIENGTVIFKSWAISKFGNVLVEEGEILAVLEMYEDPLVEEEARLKYEKALYNYENALEKKDKELENMLEDIAGETNTYQKQIMELDYEVALSAYNEYVAEQTEYIKELEATLNMYTQEAGEIYVTAPHSGIFSKSSANYTTGNTIGSEDVLGVISSFEEVLIEVPSRSAAAFNFGRTVEIKFTSTTPAITLQGKVISAPNILYNANSVSVTIAITSAFPEATTMSSSARNNASVVVTTDYVQDGIIIPSSALSNAKGNIGVVSVLENGTLVKRNVKYGYKGSNYAWILEGLEVGELVTTK